MHHINISPSVMPRSQPEGHLHLAKALWQYVESHHVDFGVALFVVPVVLVGLLLAEAICAISWLLG